MTSELIEPLNVPLAIMKMDIIIEEDTLDRRTVRETNNAL